MSEQWLTFVSAWSMSFIDNQSLFIAPLWEGHCYLHFADRETKSLGVSSCLDDLGRKCWAGAWPTCLVQSSWPHHHGWLKEGGCWRGWRSSVLQMWLSLCCALEQELSAQWEVTGSLRHSSWKKFLWDSSFYESCLERGDCLFYHMILSLSLSSPTVVLLTIRHLPEAESIIDGAARPWTFAFPNEAK